MKQVSERDFRTILGILKMVEGLPSATDRQRNAVRLAKLLRRKYENKVCTKY